MNNIKKKIEKIADRLMFELGLTDEVDMKQSATSNVVTDPEIDTFYPTGFHQQGLEREMREGSPLPKRPALRVVPEDFNPDIPRHQRYLRKVITDPKSTFKNVDTIIEQMGAKGIDMTRFQAYDAMAVQVEALQKQGIEF